MQKNNGISRSIIEDSRKKPGSNNDHKNRLIGICVCVGIMALIAGIIITVITKIRGDGYKEVAEKYATALVQENIAEINQYLPYDLKDLMGEEDFNEECEDFEEESNDERMTIHTTAINAVKIDSNEEKDDLIDDFISQINNEWGWTGVVNDNIIDTKKIKQAYKVTVKVNVYEKDEDEHWPTESFTYTIIKYKGEWKVLTAVNEDLQEMSLVW